MHIVFTGSCPDSLLEDISLNPKLVGRTVTFLEANVDFTVVMDNIFTVSSTMEQSAGDPEQLRRLPSNILPTRSMSQLADENIQDHLSKSVAFR